MKRILVPTDYSQDAHDTLLYALEMACLTGSEIVLLHAFYQPISCPFGQDYSAVVNELERQKTKKLEAYAHKVRQSILGDFSLEFTSVAETRTREEGALSKSGFHTVELDRTPARKAEVKIRCVCKFGFAPEEILKAADVHQVDLVVMGMRGDGALRRALLGRTTLQVMREATVPVLAVPLHAPFEGFKSVIFAADLFRLPTSAVLEALRQFVKLFNSHLQVLHLYHESSLEREKEKALAVLNLLDFQLYDLHYEVAFKQGEDIAAGIQRYVQEQQADLLVLVPQKHPFLERLLGKSLTQKVWSTSAVPILALPGGMIEKVS